jgi:hypothetical protein
MEIGKKIINFNFYYVVPLTLGILGGLSLRDSSTLHPNRKITMALVNYYEMTEESIDPILKKEFPDVEKIMKKIKPKENNQS